MTAAARVTAPWVLLAAAAAAPWIADVYTITVACYALVLVLVAAGAHLLCAGPGLASLGQAAYLGIGGYTAALCAQHVTTDALVQATAGGCAAAAVAALPGLALTRTRGSAFLLLTLLAGELARTVAEQSGQGLSSPAVTIIGYPLAEPGPVYLWILAVAAVLLTALTALCRSYTGLVWQGIGQHEPRIRAAGHRVDVYVWSAYLSAAAVAGTAGALLVAAHRYIGPTDLSADVSALALLAAIIGGRSLLAAAVAAAALIAVRDLLGAAWTGHGPLLMGVAFLAAAYLTARSSHTAGTPA